MKLFAGNFTLKDPIDIPPLDYDIIKIDENNYFIMWGSEEFKSSHDVIVFLQETLWELTHGDISIDGEDMLEILGQELYEQGSYECVSIEWPYIDFTEILERFAESGEVICVREAWVSQKYANRIVKVDFIY